MRAMVVAVALGIYPSFLGIVRAADNFRSIGFGRATRQGLGELSAEIRPPFLFLDLVELNLVIPDFTVVLLAA